MFFQFLKVEGAIGESLRERNLCERDEQIQRMRE